MEDDWRIPDSQMWLLTTLYHASINVPPGFEPDFEIERRADAFVITHPGLDGQALVPDWIAFRALGREGLIFQTGSKFILTSKGEVAAAQAASRDSVASSPVNADVWNSLEKATQDVSVFCAYAHSDETYLTALRNHMAVLERSGAIKVWTDRSIRGGEEWESEIDQHLLNDDIVLLLISADFFASDYCSTREMTTALERHAQGQAKVIPVIVRPCDWKESPVGFLQPLPKDGQPISGWSDRDEALADVVGGFRAILREFRPARLQSSGFQVSTARTSEESTTSLTILPQVEVAAVPAEPEQELGILDLEEMAEGSINIITERLQEVTRVTSTAESEMQRLSADLPRPGTNLPLAQRRRLAARASAIFDPFSEVVRGSAEEIESKFGIFDESLFGIHRMLDYSNGDARTQARQLMGTARSFAGEMVPFIAQIESARSSLTSIPPLTRELRSSVRDCDTAMSSFANSVRKGVEVAERIASAIQTKLDESQDSGT